MSWGRFPTYLPNPFLGIHSRRLLKSTLRSVDTFIKLGPEGYTWRKRKSVLDIALGYPNRCVGKKVAKVTWNKGRKYNPDCYWLITRIHNKETVRPSFLPLHHTLVFNPIW
eukprot:TRINITY_DN2797_c0_g1_i7.p1 TRINITY_DN2797_c0_g1~~TRINITY_DN2797_c0_g1_i7.p1  ORF type:complete len:111 (-),score=6.84 TRINITY_DN2797_c0_g1_i7:171-503(-)